jgi:hypothetical protein
MFGGKLYDNSRFPAYQTIQIVSICFPVSSEISQYITTGLSYFDRVVNDIRATWKVSLIGIFTTLVLSIILLAFIKSCGTCIVVLIILIYLGGLIGLGVACMVVSNEGI